MYHQFEIPSCTISKLTFIKFFEAPCMGIKKSNATSKLIWIHWACAGVHIMEFTMICDPPQNRVNFPYEIWKPDSWGQKLMTKGQSIFHAFSSKTSSKHKQPCKVKGVIIFLQKETWRAVKKSITMLTDYGHTKAKSLTLCGPNLDPNPK
jgi:hypothetical protein